MYMPSTLQTKHVCRVGADSSAIGVWSLRTGRVTGISDAD
jgi:hypothetical protein